MTANNYTHHALTRPDRIRVLTMEPAAHSDAPIRCTLEEAPVDGSLAYSALSYSWGMDSSGDSTQNRSILLHDKSFPVTQNLFEYLRRLREGRTTLPKLWIDAVCINQSDIAERNGQVAMMADIYKAAARTIIWLGEGGSQRDSEELKWLIQSLSDIYGKCDLRKSLFVFLAEEGKGKVPRLRYANGRVKDASGRSFPFRVEGRRGHTKGYSDMEKLLASSEYFRDLVHRRTRLIVDLVSRRYWCRRWIIQEIRFSSPQDTWLLFGGMALRWDHVYQALLLLYRNFEWFFTFWRQYNGGMHPHDGWGPQHAGLERQHKDLMDLMDLIYNGNDRSLDITRLLGKYSQQGCNDPRDRLYAFASMASIHVPINYSVETADLFTAFATKLINIEEAAGWILDNVTVKPFANLDDFAQGLPSWVPDFRGHLFRYDELPRHSHFWYPPEVIHDRILKVSCWVFGTLTLFDERIKRWTVESNGVPVLEAFPDHGNATTGDIMISTSHGTLNRCPESMTVWFVRRDVDCSSTPRSPDAEIWNEGVRKYRIVDASHFCKDIFRAGEESKGFERIKEGTRKSLCDTEMPWGTFRIV